MSIIVIKNLAGKSIPIENYSKTLLRHAQENYIDWMHSCGGKGRCTTCKVEILEGWENLGEPTPAEEKYRLNRELGERERLACQCIVRGDVTVRIPVESQLPHLTYTSEVKC